MFNLIEPEDCKPVKFLESVIPELQVDALDNNHQTPAAILAIRG